MSLSDCPRCWDTPCECGWEYRGWSLENLRKQRDMLSKVIAYKEMYPNEKLGTDKDADERFRCHLNEEDRKNNKDFDLYLKSIGE